MREGKRKGGRREGGNEGGRKGGNEGGRKGLREEGRKEGSVLPLLYYFHFCCFASRRRRFITAAPQKHQTPTMIYLFILPLSFLEFFSPFIEELSRDGSCDCDPSQNPVHTGPYWLFEWGLDT